MSQSQNTDLLIDNDGSNDDEELINGTTFPEQESDSNSTQHAKKIRRKQSQNIKTW